MRRLTQLGGLLRYEALTYLVRGDERMRLTSLPYQPAEAP